MNQDRLFQDFPISVRCESSDTVVFVACPRGGRYGDVRKTLAGLLQMDFTRLGLAPYTANASHSDSLVRFDDDEEVRDNTGDIIVRARILQLDDQNSWTLL